VTGSQKNTTGRLALADDMTGSWSAQNAILADEELLDAVCSTDLGDQLYNFWVPVSSITTNDKETVLDTLWNGEENASHEGLAVVFLLENDDLLAKSGTEAVLAELSS
jgi:hypothetical protein